MLERIRSLSNGSEGDPTGDGAGRTEGGPGGESTTAGPKRAGGLVLTRQLDQAIVIAGQVVIQVVALKLGSVRLKITAPRSIPVHRLEVYRTIQSSPRASTADASPPATNPVPGKRQGGLVLTRNLHEKVMIGDDVEVEVSDLRSNAVKLRILAPKEITVHRMEVHEAILRGDSPTSALDPASAK